MKRIIPVVLFVLFSVTASAKRVIVVEKGSVASLLEAVETANATNSSTRSERTYILIPDGDYDLGQTVLTKITGHNICLIGQSREGTVIHNKPDNKSEGISRTAIFLNRGTGNYFQDLTLRNDLDYYSCARDGRAVTLQDKGTRTVCNRVAMLSHQDTYYSDNEMAQHYMQDCEIHGTVDFICGAGDVWFERCLIVTEKRTTNGSGRNVIAAPRTSHTSWGYVFSHCTVDNIVSDFEYARGWHSQPRCAWLYTTLLKPEKLRAKRFDVNGLRTVESIFKEFGTTDAEGRNITPSSNRVTFTVTRVKKEDNVETITTSTRETETILTDSEASRYTIDNVFTTWRPTCLLRKCERTAASLKRRYFR